MLERVMIDKVEDAGSIGRNVKAFLAGGYVPDHSRELFRATLIEAGHAAMHRDYAAKAEHLTILMDLTEWLVVSIYVHPLRAERVTKDIPPRAKE